MNKFRLLAIALVIGTGSLFANSITSLEVSKEEIRQQIVELTQNTQNTIDSEFTINFSFTFNTSGEIVVQKINSKDKEVLAFIRENINHKKLENPGKAHKKFTMSIVIK